jgi:hypothetical protein
VIHKDKLCALCGKRIGEATAFSYYPNGTVVHFKVRIRPSTPFCELTLLFLQCSKDKHIEPSSGRDFRVTPIP